jgi:outer membrane lipoprotein-sorting protein
MRKLSSDKKISTLCCALLCLLGRMEAQSCEDIFNKMFSATKNVKTLRAKISSAERIDDHLNYTHFAFKINAAPYKAYSKDLDKGIEVLYLEGKNDNEATVNPNGFPYVNLHLDPYGKVMRKDQHQTIKNLGFNYISNILYHSLAKYPDAYAKYIKRDADTVWEGKACYKVEINFSAYTYSKYTVTEEGETVSKLAAKYYLSEYKILTLNNISWYDDELKVGQQILLPSAYAKTTILFINKENNLPVVIRTYDDKGFFEEYDYTNIQVNSTIADSEFTENYPGYHF